MPVHPTSVLLQFAFGMPLGFPCLVSCTGCLTALLAGPRPPMGQAATKMISELVRSFRFCKNITSALHTLPYPAGKQYKNTTCCISCIPQANQLAICCKPQAPSSAHSVPTQCPLSCHSVTTQLPLVIRGTRAFKSLNLFNMFSLFSNIPHIYRGHCVGTEWALCGH